MRRTKIVATLGPTSSDVEVIKDLIRAGLDAARVNFSHGTYESHGKIIQTLKQAREELNVPIPLILDTKGPEIRIKKFKGDKIFLEQGKKFTLTSEDVEGDENIVSVTYKDLPKDLKLGSLVLLDDGLIELKVTNLTDTEVECVAVNSGFLSSGKGVNIPDVYVNLPALTEKDIEDIHYGIEQEFDYIAASFIRSASDVMKIREVLEKNGGQQILIIAKIENRDGVNNIDAILEVSDGIMVARGDLGVEIPLEEVPLVQKEIIRKANEKGKPVITATQMLESMVNNPRPTRAEANDVANAIFDGSDSIMLSGETAKGSHPVESVKMMARIAQRTEANIDYGKTLKQGRENSLNNVTNAISYAACTTALDLNASAVVAVTDSGFAARMVSRFRPTCPIVAVASTQKVWRQLNLSWGVVPTIAEELHSEDIFTLAINKSIECGVTKNGETAVIVTGIPVGAVGTTNTLKVQIVGDVIVKGTGYGNKVVSGNANVVKVMDVAEKYFTPGNILVTTNTSDLMMPFIKKASAIVMGSWESIDPTHAITVASALDIPLIVCNQKVIDLISDGLPVTIDAENGFVYYGLKEVTRRV